MAFVPDGHKQSILKILNGLPQEGADAVLRTLKFQMEANPDNPVRDATRYTAVLAKKFKTGELIVAGTHVDNEKAILSKQIAPPLLKFQEYVAPVHHLCCQWLH